MNIDINWAYLLAGSFGVAGVIQYLKNAFPAVPVRVWQIASPVAAVGVALAGGGEITQIATNSILLLALTQLAYDNVIRLVQKLIDNVANKAVPGDGK
jgi:hypothetical protein